MYNCLHIRVHFVLNNAHCFVRIHILTRIHFVEKRSVLRLYRIYVNKFQKISPSGCLLHLTFSCIQSEISQL